MCVCVCHQTGDPTVFGNLLPSETSLTAIKEATRADGKFNGYPPSIGYPDAREAVAKSLTHDAAPLTANDIILASGCSGRPSDIGEWRW